MSGTLTVLKPRVQTLQLSQIREAWDVPKPGLYLIFISPLTCCVVNRTWKLNFIQKIFMIPDRTIYSANMICADMASHTISLSEECENYIAKNKILFFRILFLIMLSNLTEENTDYWLRSRSWYSDKRARCTHSDEELHGWCRLESGQVWRCPALDVPPQPPHHTRTM